MKVKLIGYNTLERAIKMEGDIIVEKDEELLLDESNEKSLPEVAMDALGFSFGHGNEAFSVTKRFAKSWGTQTFVSFPLPYLMDGDLGYKMEAGRTGRYIQDNPYDTLFENLNVLLSEMKYQGFVSLRFNQKKELVDIFFGAGLALYCMLEGVKGKITKFFTGEEGVLESWTISLILSRYPYPFKETSNRLFLKIFPSIEKHLWFYALKSHRKSFYIDSTKICIVSAWATSLNEAARRVYRTCEGLDIPLKQYRIDVAPYASKQWVHFISSE